MADLGVFSRYKGFNDYQDEAQKNSLAAALAQSQIARAQKSEDLPASLMVANEFKRRLDSGDIEGAKQLAAFAKVSDPSSMFPNATPQPTALPWNQPASPKAPKSSNLVQAGTPEGNQAIVDLYGGDAPATPVVLSSDKTESPKLIGDDFLKTLDPKRALVIKLIGDGNEKSSTVLSRMKPEDKISILSDVAQYNPKYSANDFPGVATFNRGTEGKTVRSFNVAIEHLNTLEPLITALGNGDTQLVNKISNSISGQFGGVPINNFDTAKSIVADEIAKAVIGGQNAEKDRADLQARVNASKSTDQLMGAVSTFKDLMAGQLSGLNQQYKASTGRDDFEERLLLPNAKAEYAKHKDASPNLYQKGNADFSAKKVATPDEIAEYKRLRGIQ